MVSIIIPFNKGKEYLFNCLSNICRQKYYDYEVILIDDFSEDNSEKIVNNFENKLNIKYYKTTEKTIGVGNARNFGIQKANGNYIMFVDVDDTIEEDLLINLEEYMEQKIEMIKYRMKIRKNDKETLIKSPIFETQKGEDAFNKLCFKDIFLDSPCLYLISRKLLENVNLRFEKNVYHEDFGFIPELMINAKSVISTEYYGYNYNQTNNSIMRNDDYLVRIKKAKDKIFHYDNLFRNLNYFNITDKTKENILAYYTNSIILATKNLSKEDRKFFEIEIKQKKILDNLKVKNIRQYLKKIILKNRMDLYFKLEKFLGMGESD